MEQEVLHLLEGTTSAQEGTRKSAELTLLHLYNNADFPFALLSISTHTDIASYLRQAALLSLNRYVQATWSPKFDEDFKGTVVLTDEGKAGVRAQVLSICTSDIVAATDDRKVKNAASLVASKIASVDFPEEWPELLPTLLQIISGTGPDSQVHGALRVLSELVESGFSEEQFFAVARDLVNGLQTVALNANRKPIVRAMAMSVFRACFDTLEMVMEDHKAAVKAFLNEALNGWMPFFVETIKLVLPEPPPEADETKDEGLPSQWRGLIALKLQVVKVRPRFRRGKANQLMLCRH
jgi:truncated hemoglobin YjbI